MKNYLATATLAMSVLASAAQGAEWQSDYGDALAATRADNQPLLVVLDEPQTEATRIEPALLSEGSAKTDDAKQFENYNLCHVDVTTKYGKKVARAFKAKRFPHVAIIDRSGSVVIFKKSGKMDSKEWTSVLKTHRNGERVAARHVSYKLNGDSSDSAPTYHNKSYCPSCQRKSW